MRSWDSQNAMESMEFKKGRQQLTSCGGSIAVDTPGVSRGRGDVQQHLKPSSGSMAVGTLGA